MPLEPLPVTPRQERHASTSSHCQCGQCFKTPANKNDDAFQSDSSTANEVKCTASDAPGIFEYHGGSRHSHAKLVRKTPTLQRPVGSGNSFSVTHVRVKLIYRVLDPFDYEQKYPPDEEFKELSERSRFYKTYMDECTKFDLDMVENWRDGLDMLLVFVSSDTY